MIKIPEINSKWKHKSGKTYTVLMITNENATKQDYPITVVYKDNENNVWSRTLEKWSEMEKLI
jgi:hypothetical protein